MKRIISFLLISIFAASVSYSDSMINDIEDFSKLFPRPEGSINDIKTMQLIAKRLDTMNVKYTEVNFSEAEGYHSFSSYIEADIPGAIEDTLITLIPVQGSYEIAAALTLIDHYTKKAPELSLKFVFLGAEESPDQNLGTKNFLSHYYQESPASFIYFNFPEISESFRIVPGADDFSSPFLLFESINNALDSTSIPYFHSNTESILFRLSAAGTPSMIKTYLEEGYPAIELTSYKTADSYDKMVGAAALTELYDHLLKSFEHGLPSDWDSHYIFGFDEQQYLLIYIVILTMLMIYPIFRRRHFGWYMKTLLKNIWILPLLFGFIFVFLSIASMLITLLLSRIGFAELWKYNPIIVFLFKISVSLLFYSLAFKLIKKLPFSKRGSFYSISAIFFLLIELFILSWINLSLSFFALWPLFFIFLFTIFKKPLLKLILLLVSSVWIIFSLVEIFTLPSLPVLKLIILSPVQGDLLIALVLLPFILSAIRVDLMSPPSRSFTKFLPVIFGALSTGLFVLILVFSPFSESNPMPIKISETIDGNSGDREFSIESPVSVNDSMFQDLIDSINLLSDKDENITIDVKTKSFLNRKIVNIKLDFSESPNKVKISINSPKAVTLFESSFPADWLPSQNRLDVYIGRNPVVPIEFSLTLNRDAELNLLVEAECPAIFSEQLIGGKFYYINYVRTVLKNYTDEE